MNVRTSTTFSVALGSISMLTACSPSLPTQTQTHEMYLQNPLYAERYYDEFIENMVEIEIQKNPIADDPQKKRLIELTRKDSLQKVREVNTIRDAGKMATMLSMETYTKGLALITDTHLFFSPDFETTPGIDLHVFLTKAVDPRDVTFPDETAVDLGALQGAYGPQSITLPSTMTGALHMRSVVLWDSALDRLQSFGQLSS